MKKKIIGSLLLIFSVFILSGCSSNSENAKTESKKSGGVADVCNYFPKELVEKAIDKSIVKVEASNLMDPTCNYYTKYDEKYDHTPYGDKPGGPHVVVVYDTKDFTKDKITNEKSGTKYETNASIFMDNFVMRDKANKVWQTALVLGGEKYIRIKDIDNAVTGDQLIKIAREFATRL